MHTFALCLYSFFLIFFMPVIDLWHLVQTRDLLAMTKTVLIRAAVDHHTVLSVFSCLVLSVMTLISSVLAELYYERFCIVSVQFFLSFFNVTPLY